MNLPQEAQIVIIGGGVFGTSAAFHLAKDGYRDIVLIDRGPLASGTTPFAAGQTGWLNTMTGSVEGPAIARYSLDFYENFAGRTGHSIDFHQNGSVRVALTDRYRQEMEEWVNVAKRLDFPVQWLDAADAEKMVPVLKATGATGMIFIPKDAFVEPKGVAVAYASGARDLGVNIQVRTRATRVEFANGKVAAVHTDRGTIRAKWLVVAAGAWTRQFAQVLGIRIKAVPVRHQSFVTAPTAQVSSQQPIVRIVEPQLYARPDRGGLLVGGYGHRQISFNMAEDFADDFTIPSLPPDPIYYHRLFTASLPFFPCLKDAVIVQEQVGLPTMTPDARHIVSKVPEADGLIFAVGCQVGGISISPAIGRMIADLIGGRDSLKALAAFDAKRFGGDYDEEPHLRSACEEKYGRLYLRLG